MAREHNFIATFPNWVDSTFVGAGFDGVTLSGGQWQPGTLDYLRDELMATSAVSLDLLPSSTELYFDLGVTRQIKIVAIPDSNTSRDGQIQMQIAGGDNAGFDAPAGDTGWRDVWNVVYPLGTLPSTHPSWKDGKLTEEDRASGYRMPWFHIFGDDVLGRYGRLRINDPTNSDGFIRLPRLFVAGGWQASINMVWGRGLSYEFGDVPLESLGGTDYYDLRRPRRIAVGTFDALPDDEAYAFPLEMQRRLRGARQTFISIDPTTETRRHQNSFLATIRQANPIEAAYFGLSRTGFVFKEVI